VPRWVPRVLTRIRTLVAGGRVIFTDKAISELADLYLACEDAVEILRLLGSGDDPARLRSQPLHEWLYIFRPTVAGQRLYLKVALRTGCVVISCHEDPPETSGETDRDE